MEKANKMPNKELKKKCQGYLQKGIALPIGAGWGESKETGQVNETR